MTYLKGLNQKDLSDKGLLTQAGITKYANYLNSSQVLAGFDPATTAPESVLSSVFGTDNMQTFKDVVAQVKLLNDTNLGDDLSGGLLDIVDKNHDGVIDDIGTIVKTAKSFFSGKSVKDLLVGADGTPDVADGPGLLKAIQASISTAQTTNPLYISYVGADNKGVLADGKIDDADVGRLNDAPLEDLQKMMDKGVPGASKLQNLLTQRVNADTATAINSLSPLLGSFMRGATVSSEDTMTGLKAAWEAIQSGSLPTSSQVVKDSINKQFKTLVQKQQDTIIANKTKEIEAIPERKQLADANANWQHATDELTKLKGNLESWGRKYGKGYEYNQIAAKIQTQESLVQHLQGLAHFAGITAQQKSNVVNDKYDPMLNTLRGYK